MRARYKITALPWLLALGLLLCASGLDAAERSALFVASMPEQALAEQKTVLHIAMHAERTEGSIPSVAITWLEKPQGKAPSVLVGVPQTDITFHEPGHYVLEARVTLVYKNSCALASTGEAHTQRFTVQVDR